MAYPQLMSERGNSKNMNKLRENFNKFIFPAAPVMEGSTLLIDTSLRRVLDGLTITIRKKDRTGDVVTQGPNAIIVEYTYQHIFLPKVPTNSFHY